MSQPSRCAACLHPRVADIDHALLAKRSVVDISKMAGLSYDQVRRHRDRGHIASAAPRVPMVAPPPGTVSGVASLESLLSELDQTDTSKMSSRELNDHREMRRRVADSLTRSKPAVDAEGPAQRSVVLLEEMIAAQDSALERFPEARKAVAEAVVLWRRTRIARPGEEQAP